VRHSKFDCSTSALGQKQTWHPEIATSALPPKADIAGRQLDVRFVPKAVILRCSTERRYSITSSARPSNGSSPQAQGCADFVYKEAITARICTLRNGVQGSSCTAATLRRRCPLWVISCRGAVKLGCPLSPRKLPRQSPTGAAVKGHKRTHAPQQKARSLFDHLVGGGEERWRDGEAEHRH
jgi:hypothetical protein